MERIISVENSNVLVKMEIRLDLRKSVEQNAEIYFERAKKLKHKIAGARETVERTGKSLQKLEGHRVERPEAAEHKAKKEWYHKFRWFFSSEDFLVIGGRDATSNEIVIKKHTEPNDLVFHTDMAGSPFFVVKVKNEAPTQRTLLEAADATCSFSRAWRLGLASTSVFYVKPAQVTKQANTGEYLTKGAFVIRGRTNYVENKINVAVGLFQGAVMAGPLDAVKKHCEKFVQVVPGDKKVSDVAKMVRKLVGGGLDEIVRALPGGNCELRR
jgi:predicted ribosome quality control (RQC) complex YloA/Tae2 family protein